jgi:two-component system chemotaxis sensor kinase CheA
MFEAEENEAAKCLNDQLDAISTRLILDGVASVSSADFEALSGLAQEKGYSALAQASRQLAEQIAPPATFAIPELTRVLSSSLVDFRKLIEEAVATRREERAGSKQEVAPIPVTAEALPLDEEEEASPAMESGSLAADADLVLEFITESVEHLTSIERQMLLLEKDNTAAETLNAVFRGFHTIKGLAGFLEFAAIESLAHEVETLLDRARTGQLAVSPSVVDVVLESMDVVRQEIGGIQDRLEGNAPPPSQGNEKLLRRIRAVAKGEAVARTTEPTRVDVPANVTMVPSSSAQAMEVATDAFVTKTAKAEAGVIVEPVKPERRSADAASVRIDTAKLDQLMDMVGEMVIAQTLIGHSPVLAAMKDAKLQGDLAQLARITADVQRITTGMRMVPIGIQFQKTSRMIRDLSRKAGKLIEFETSGEDTELDKSIAEQLADPLLHMVRNSVDHGIEPPEERVKAGKEPTAHIRVAAYHQSGQIVLAISDDGRGLNKERILAKATQNGLIQKGQQLTENEIFMLIFEAGFSTAEKITDISGRGVGMDVVRRHVQKLRGRIDIHSKEGEGTTFYLKLPLTLAIIESLVVAVGDQRYIVPIFSVREMFRPNKEMLSTVQGAGEMVMVRNSLMPISRLHRAFNRVPRTTNLMEGTLIVAESEGHPFCLFVDDLIGKQEVVIKSLGPNFKNVVGIAGCAILGDGRVGLILDVDGIYKSRAA